MTPTDPTEGAPAPATPQGPVEVILVIKATIHPNGSMGVRCEGPVNNQALCDQMLFGAHDSIREFNRQMARERGVLVVGEGLLRHLPGHNAPNGKAG